MADNTYYTRTAAGWVKYMSAHFPCVLLTGARQVGKSTLLEEVLPAGMNYVTLDDYTLAAEARRDPIGFLREHEAPLFIDEVQYAPELFRAIKMRVDAAKRNGMYWMTGSQHFQLMEGVSESLAGRVGIIDLYSMSQRECLGLGEAAAPLFSPDKLADYAAGVSACGIHELYRRIWRGGYPVLSKDTELEPLVLFESYVRTYLERDVNQLSQVENRAAFLKLMRSAAARTGQQLVYSDLARPKHGFPSWKPRVLSPCCTRTPPIPLSALQRLPNSILWIRGFALGWRGGMTPFP